MNVLPTDSALARWKGRVDAVRERARALLAAGTPGIQIASAIREETDAILLELIAETSASVGGVGTSPTGDLARKMAIVAVGGTGRGDLAPYSDIDLLFLYARDETPQFREFVARFVQSCWDAKLNLGHAVRDIATCITLARQDPQIATSLVEARLLWGNEKLFERFLSRFKQRVVSSRHRQFIEDCLAARSEGWSERGPAAQELEPDVKASAGGLRDLHLIRWIGFARYGIRDIEALRLQRALTNTDARKLQNAWEFLTKLRIDLHLAAGKAQDRLTRDEQLRIAEQRGFRETSEQRAVEQFMREYFHHSSELAAIARRFVAIERPRSMRMQTRDLLMGHRAEGIYYVGTDWIDIAERHLPLVRESVESMLRFYKTAALYNLPPSPRVAEAIQEKVAGLQSRDAPDADGRTVEEPHPLSRECARLFVDIFKCTAALGPVVRSMFNTGLLDVVIPDVTRVRNLMQFNQYHHFTVDEHTLRAVETVTGFERDEGPIGTSYRAIRHKEVLHLAVLLHDLGKGETRDHCEVGHEIALRIGRRLSLPEFETAQLALLVLKHLEMADIALRRDITDPRVVIEFAREIGSPETLRMLYVLTAADVTAVGPGTWTNWKAGLLTEFFDRCLVTLSGKRYSFHEQERIREVKTRVVGALSAAPLHEMSLHPDAERGPRLGQETSVRPPGATVSQPASPLSTWVDRQLNGFSAYYLTCTPPEQIAEDLRVIGRLDGEPIEVARHWNEETGTTEYRVITRNPLALRGAFHKMCGVLTAKRLEILSADINTTTDGVLVDSYRVLDRDYEGQPPESRCDEIGDALRSVLSGKETVEGLFHRHRRFGTEGTVGPVSNLPLRVKIDNDSSETRTIIDVFAYDRPGLLYTITRALFELGLSVDAAKIDTHFDQVVDVFYVQEADTDKVRGGPRLREIHDRLYHALREFEEGGHREFTQRISGAGT
jgi:[protein-PII] uridylyltransferase